MMRRYWRVRHSSSKWNTQVIGSIVVGVFLGVFIGLWLRQTLVPCISSTHQSVLPVYPIGMDGAVGAEYMGAEDMAEENHPPVLPERVDTSNFSGKGTAKDKQPLLQPPSKGFHSKKLLLVGVMTAKKYLNTRIIASYQTWAKTIPGDVIYFSSEGSEEIALPGLPVIGLKGVDDSYPPQKKSFLMLKYMHDIYRDRYEWFMRADDDLYIKGDELAKFLRSINSSNPHFIGQAGLGNKDEFGLLALDKNENFCMGGPGMVLSRVVLENMAPHISYCLKNLFTTHEDVEIGRCIQKFAQTSCTWAFEMQSLFHHNHQEPNGSYTQQLRTKDVYRALTLHPFKNHTYQYRMHTFLQYQRRSERLRHRSLLLQRAVNDMDELLRDRDDFYSPDRLGQQPSLRKFEPQSGKDVLDWQFISNKRWFSYKTANPQPGISTPFKDEFDDIMRQVIQMINKNARQRGRTIDFKEILYGYQRVDPLHGADYILDLLLTYRKHKGHKMTVAVRRHAYLQQTFSAPEFREDPSTDDTLRPQPQQQPESSSDTNSQQGLFNIMQEKFNFFKPLAAAATERVFNRRSVESPQWKSRDEKVLHFILTLSGRHATFKRFLMNLEAVALKREPIFKLVVVLFESKDPEEDFRNEKIIAAYQQKYPQHSLSVAKKSGAFSRGVGLEYGSSFFSSDALLVFMDVDIYLNTGSIDRLKWNTIASKQVYFPVVFSQFDPETYTPRTNAFPVTASVTSDPFIFAEHTGYWRAFGFGIAAVYKSDFLQVGGFDKSLKGWGLEDVKLFEKYLKQNITVFRTADPGMVHIFHPIICDPLLDPDQYQACLGTKAANYGSVSSLAKIVRNIPSLYNRGDVRQDGVDGGVDGVNDNGDIAR